jgi:LPS-assembly protein
VIPFENGFRDMVRAFFCSLCVCVSVLYAASAGAQQPVAGAPKTEEQNSDSIERISDTHTIRIGNVEIREPNGTNIYADRAELFQDEDRAILIGNVVFSQGDSRMTAERAELNTKTGLGTFYNAWGFSTLKPPKPTVRPGAAPPPPQVAGEETSVYFFGDVVEKLAAKKYRITKGGFSTCVQPTPRWNLDATTVTLNLDHYTLLRNAVLSVKGVPMFYLPVMYYPTKKDGRATGLLIPTYGSSSLRGQSFQDAFFWAIDRSQDATLSYDFFSKTGQGVGAEYRYNFGTQANGYITTHYDDSHDATYVQDDGSTTVNPGSKSYEITGALNQTLPGHLLARANVSYFSSLANSQAYNTNIYDASRDERTVGGNLIGAWGTYTMNATFNHSEYFYDANDSALSGSWPQIQFARAERPLFDTPLYFSVSTEFAHLLRDSRSTTTDPTTNVSTTTNADSSLTRLDFFPQVRYPFKKWQWLTVNTTFAWRDTYYSRSLDPTDDITPVNVPINRQFYTATAQITGPVFSRVWDTPDNGFAEKFKHSIEPSLNIQTTSNIQNIAQIIQFDGTDSYVGGTMLTYGVINRFYAKRKIAPGQPAQAREILDVELTQTYYTNQTASQYDHQYMTTSTTLAPSNYSPIALSIRAMPSTDFNATFRAEYDEHYLKPRELSAQGTYAWTQRVQTSVGWTKTGYIQGLPGFDDCRVTPQPPCIIAPLDQSINVSANVHSRDNRVGTLYSFNYDFLQHLLLQQSFSLFYNAQCCGIQAQYQTYNYGASSFLANTLPADHRFFISFTLAGLGNFSPFNSTPH